MNQEMNMSGRLSLSVRRNKGRTEYAYYATELAHMLKIAVSSSDLLDLEETDRLFAVHRDQSVRSANDVGFAFKKEWKYDLKPAWLSVCECLGDKLVGELAVLFAGPYEFCGGLRVNPGWALKAVIPLLEFDQNTIRLQSASSESGLFIDLFEQDSEWMVELVVWGRWKQIAEACV
jgi:hypothetical protein